jgi:hypothetical protein
MLYVPAVAVAFSIPKWSQVVGFVWNVASLTRSLNVCSKLKNLGIGDYETGL